MQIDLPEENVKFWVENPWVSFQDVPPNIAAELIRVCQNALTSRKPLRVRAINKGKRPYVGSRFYEKFQEVGFYDKRGCIFSAFVTFRAGITGIIFCVIVENDRGAKQITEHVSSYDLPDLISKTTSTIRGKECVEDRKVHIFLPGKDRSQDGLVPQVPGDFFDEVVSALEEYTKTLVRYLD